MSPPCLVASSSSRKKKKQRECTRGCSCRRKLSSSIRFFARMQRKRQRGSIDIGLRASGVQAECQEKGKVMVVEIVLSVYLGDAERGKPMPSPFLSVKKKRQNASLRNAPKVASIPHSAPPTDDSAWCSLQRGLRETTSGRAQTRKGCDRASSKLPPLKLAKKDRFVVETSPSKPGRRALSLPLPLASPILSRPNLARSREINLPRCHYSPLQNNAAHTSGLSCWSISLALESSIISSTVAVLECSSQNCFISWRSSPAAAAAAGAEASLSSLSSSSEACLSLDDRSGEEGRTGAGFPLVESMVARKKS